MIFANFMYDFCFLLLLAKVYALSSNRCTITGNCTGSPENHTKGMIWLHARHEVGATQWFKPVKQGKLCSVRFWESKQTARQQGLNPGICTLLSQKNSERQGDSAVLHYRFLTRVPIGLIGGQSSAGWRRHVVVCISLSLPLRWPIICLHRGPRYVDVPLTIWAPVIGYPNRLFGP